MKFIKFAMMAAILFAIAQAFWAASDPTVQRKRQEELQAKTRADQQAAMDGWAKWIEDAKRNNKERPKTETDPNWKTGFESGYMAGLITARGGSQRPDSSNLESMARKAATANGLSDSGRSSFTAGYSAGFGFGWDKGK
jgi:hypothetical protein